MARLLTVLFTIWLTSANAIQITLDHSHTVEGPIGERLVKHHTAEGRFVKDTNATNAEGTIPVPMMRNITMRDMRLARRLFFQNLTGTMTFKILEELTSFMKQSPADQRAQLNLPNAQCNITEIEFIFNMLQGGEHAIEDVASEAVPDSEQLDESTGKPMIWNFPTYYQTFFTHSRPEVREACSGFKTPSWKTFQGCVSAFTNTRGQCSQCFVNTIQNVVGTNFFAAKSSCATRCISDMNTRKKLGPDCEGCLLPEMEGMMTCVGVDLKAFEFGGAPALGQASSLVPLQTITALLTLMTLGLAGLF